MVSTQIHDKRRVLAALERTTTQVDDALWYWILDGGRGSCREVGGCDKKMTKYRQIGVGVGKPCP
jgi:hypothetical protein